jgi:hypothetical protein
MLTEMLTRSLSVSSRGNENPASAGLSKVERAGIEPATSGLQSRRSPS